MDWSPPCKPALRPAAFIAPCVPTLAKEPPTGPAWVHEIKHDGYRVMVWRDGERVRLFTRRGYDWTHRYPRIVHSGRRLQVTRFLIDGEAVVCGEAGISDFEKLHSREHDPSVILYAFDLLAIDGADIRKSGSRIAAQSSGCYSPIPRAFCSPITTPATATLCSVRSANSGSKASCRSAGIRSTARGGARAGSRSRIRTALQRAGMWM